MTFKSIVESWVRGEAFTALENLLTEQGIDYRYTMTRKIELEKDVTDYMWTVEIDVTFTDYTSKTYKVGGTVDDLLGVCVSCVWNGERLAWLFNELGRYELGIDKFVA